MIGKIFRILGALLVMIAALITPGGKSEVQVSRGREKAFRRRRWLVPIAVFLFLLMIGGAIVATSGIVPIKASSGHWAVTRWLLNFGKERSIATHSMGTKPPKDWNEDWRIWIGAGHYETGCRPCHGSPGSAMPRIPFAMTPNPPRLGENLKRFDPAELFYLVKHGIKFTGMPAWPAQHRDDEVWSMVAFLQRLPQLSRDEYRHLAIGEAEKTATAPVEDMLAPSNAPAAVEQSCARCHGFDGNGRGKGAFPKLAGQKVEYLYQSLRAYSKGERESGIMEPIAASLEDSAIRELAEFYSSQVRNPPEENLDPARIERGREIARNGLPDQNVAACVACHGPYPTRRNQVFPVLHGQPVEYLVRQIELFQGMHRGGTEFHHLMHFTVIGLDAEQRRDVAHYYSSLQLPEGGQDSR